MRPGFKKFVCRSLLALLPVAAYIALYLVLDPFGVVHRYDGISIAPGDTLERMPNKRYVAIEGLKFYNAEHHYDSFIFGSSISSNFTVAAWKKHLPADASVYHFTAGAETLTGIRDELKYLITHGYPVRHALLIIEEEMFTRSKRYEEMPYVPHYDVSPEISWLHFQRVHFNAFRDFDMLLYQLWPTQRLADKLLMDGKMIVLGDPDTFYKEQRPWLVNMQPLPSALPLRIDAQNESLLRDIAAMLRDNHVDYVVIVPPRFRSQPLSAVDHALMCEIMGEDRVNDFSNDSTLIHDLYSYYDGVHILTYRCTELIDRSYAPKSPLKLH